MNAEKQRNPISRAWWLPLTVAASVFAIIQLLPLVGVYLHQDVPLPDIPHTPIEHHETMQHQPEKELVQIPDENKSKFSDTSSAILSIPVLHITVPIIWSKSTKEPDLQNDLSNGAIHYPGTAIPGNIGNALIAAHSSDYIWKKGKYKSAFAPLNKLSAGDTGIFITYTNKNGQQHTLQFQVSEKAIVTPNDQRIFSEDNKPQITLITCWPIGTNWRRLMVKADLVL